ncbi:MULTISPECIES: GGDEF domain-containing protein [unclassified Novosphingobium]|uniref:GGDEF domain-containing protein n=1 Tax=unclassified Novosphingobium TaxID=2644732 RepID=UPI00135C642F|nr:MULTISPECIES: GGDEF domain-containing protein [unclassified Novosphingobium]
MAVDAQTMMWLTDGIAFVAATFLFIEWRTLHERFLLSFALGFLCIVVGCSLAPLREAGSFYIGIWLSNSMLPLAHLCFLHGTAAFVGHRLARAWFFVPALCSGLMAMPHMDAQTLSLFNAGCVAVLSLSTAGVLLGERRTNGSETQMLLCTFLFHGGFYAVKALSAFAPGAFVNLYHYSGTMIVISLFEGVLVEVALAMSIAGALRRRREHRVTRLAESDPLTGLLNRRGFEAQAKSLLAKAGKGGGALLLIDVDHFKTVNDSFGHQEGDRLLVALARYLQLETPVDAVIGRLGGDEFAVILPRLDEAAALQFAQGLCSGFGRRVGPQHCGTLSIGCASFGAGTGNLSEVHLQADRGLYDAKSKGRNRPGLGPQNLRGYEDEGPFFFPFAAAG